MEKSESDYLARYNVHDFDVPLTTVDVVVFALVDERLCVQLVTRTEHPYKGCWALPGGFVRIDVDDDLDAAARRVLNTKTGVETPYLEQLGGFGDKHRDPRGWAATFVYFSLIDARALTAGLTDGRWWSVSDKGVDCELAFDHAQLVAAALSRLRSKVTYTSLPMHLLPERFTLSYCQHVFELVLGQALEKSAFRRRLKDAALVEAIPGAFERGPNRPAALYRLSEGASTVFFPGALRGSRS